MIHYFAKHVHASAVGRRIDSVTCERCGALFHYELARVGVGRATAPYYLFQQRASGLAAGAARGELATRLTADAELVPCPKCNWVNESLIERYRARRFRGAGRWIAGGIVGGIVFGSLAQVTLPELLGEKSAVPIAAALTFWGIGLLSPAWVLLLRHFLRGRIDPNRTFPLRPIVPPGTPPALVDHIDRRTGDRYLVPAGDGDAPPFDGEWAVFRPGQLAFPQVCGMCMEPARTTFQSPFKVNDRSDLAVPLCWACAAQLQRRWWVAAAITAGLAIALAAALAQLVPHLDPWGRRFLFGILTLFVGLFAVAIVPGHACQPWRLRRVDGDRGIVRFRSDNPEYTRLLVEQARAAERQRKITPRNA